jgi:hypothetical protein
MKLTMSILLLILIWPLIAPVTAVDIDDDPRYLAARDLRNEARADWTEAKAEVASARQAYATCLESGDPPAVELDPIARRVELAIEAAARAEDRFTNADTAASRVLVSIVNPPSTSRSAADHDDKSEPSTTNKKKGKRPAIADLEREIKTPPGGWFDSKGMVHKLHALACAELNKNLALAWKAVDQLQPARDGPVITAVAASSDADSDEEAPVPPTPPTDSIPKARAMAAVTALAALIHALLEKGKRLHISHTHGNKVAQFFEEDDPIRQGSDGERLKRAIKAEKEEADRKKSSEKKTSRYSRGGYTGSSGRSRGSSGRDRYHGDRGRWPSSSGSTRRCYICDSADHMSSDCPKKHKRS